MRFAALLCLLTAALEAQGPPAAVTPADLPLKEQTEIRIACQHMSGFSRYSDLYHYRLWLPKGFLAAKDARWKCLFIASPSGNAKMGEMEAWLRRKGTYVVVMLEESRNGPWDPSVGNFLAAAEDVERRVRLLPGGRVATGFSGGARASSVFAALGDGFGGVILQGAGIGRLDNGMPGLKGTQLAAIVVTMGKGDPNRAELPMLKQVTDGRIEVMEFAGGHQWAPRMVIERALDYVDARLPK